MGVLTLLSAEKVSSFLAKIVIVICQTSEPSKLTFFSPLKRKLISPIVIGGPINKNAFMSFHKLLRSTHFEIIKKSN